MYAFFAGPMLWIAAIVCIGGLFVRAAFLIGLSRERDRVIYNHVNMGWGIRSILHWLIPGASAGMRQQPVFTAAGFVFHAGLLVVPFLLDAHLILLEQTLGIRWWGLPDSVADGAVIAMLAASVILIGRRIVRPEVRVLTTAWDYGVWALTILPFATGMCAYHQWGPSETMLLVHVISGDLLLIVIPFSKLGHMILFFFTRLIIGFEMGGRRNARAW